MPSEPTEPTGATVGPAAVLLDLDGTLLDTVDVWRAAYRQLAGELGTTLADDFWPSIAGLSMQGSLRALGPAAAQHDPVELVTRLVAMAASELDRSGASGWRWLPGAGELLAMLGGPDTGGTPGPRGPRTALVTSAWRAFTLPLLDAALAEGARTFGAVVCGDDVARSKPAPDPYLRAAELLEVAPHECLVIEDSPTGVAAAEAAGMVVLVVPHAGPVAAAPGRAVRHDLVGLTREDLASMYTRLRSGSAH
jgi:beta-phosphoglucomutase-like phosphatase (HAD superfamily)